MFWPLQDFCITRKDSMGEMPVEIHLAIRADPVVVSSLQSHFESSKRLLDGIIMTLQKKKKKKVPFSNQANFLFYL